VNPNGTLWQIATLLLPMIVAIVCHEVAHGWVAWMLGDPTAYRARRLSLNPLRHVDPVGTLLVPGFLALVHGPIFGWAKPVPIDGRQLNNPRLGMMAVAAAGPATNLLLAALAAAGLGLMARFGIADGGLSRFASDNLNNFLMINVFLALFNLLPVPPFDGSHIVEGLLPRGAARTYERLRPFGLALMLVLLVVVPYVAPQLGIVRNLVLPPAEWAGNQYYALARRIAGRSAA
jgi:Zn-dependent protease